MNNIYVYDQNWRFLGSGWSFGLVMTIIALKIHSFTFKLNQIAHLRPNKHTCTPKHFTQHSERKKKQTRQLTRNIHNSLELLSVINNTRGFLNLCVVIVFFFVSICDSLDLVWISCYFVVVVISTWILIWMETVRLISICEKWTRITRC